MAKKKVAIAVDLQVRLDAVEYEALQRALKKSRKPTLSQVKQHFEGVINDAIAKLVDEHGGDDE
jgi:hypothetical protein